MIKVVGSFGTLPTAVFKLGYQPKVTVHIVRESKIDNLRNKCRKILVEFK